MRRVLRMIRLVAEYVQNKVEAIQNIELVAPVEEEVEAETTTIEMEANEVSYEVTTEITMDLKKADS